MKYYILQFKFLTPVHFGTAENKKSGNLQSFNCCADTFFSALVTETAALDGELCSRFIEAVQKGGLLFSDFLPYYSGGAGCFSAIFCLITAARKKNCMCRCRITVRKK